MRGVIVDSDMDILPTGAMNAAATIAGDTTADGLEASDFFDVEVEQIAGVRVFVTKHGRRRFKVTNTTEMESAQNAAHRGAADSGGHGDANPGPTLASQNLNPNHQVGMAAARAVMGARRTIAQPAATFALVTAHPLGGGFGADLNRLQPRSKSLAAPLRFERELLD